MSGRKPKLWGALEHDWFRTAHVRRLSSDAKVLFMAARLYASEHFTDGLIEEELLPMLAAEARVPLKGLAAELQAAGVWDAQGDGFLRDVDFLAVNDKAAVRLGRWQRDRDRKERKAEQSTAQSEQSQSKDSDGIPADFHVEIPARETNGNGYKAAKALLASHPLLGDLVRSRNKQQGEQVA